MVATSLARDIEKVSRSQAAWLKKRWNRHQWPMPTLPQEKMTSVMERWRWERIQPVTISAKVWEVGAVKTGAKCCSRARNEGVSSMSRLPLLGVGCPESAPDNLPI